MRVNEVMTADVITVTPDTGIKAAARAMVDNGVSGLPVVDEGGHLVGMITEADFLAQAAARAGGKKGKLLSVLFGSNEVREHAETVGQAMTKHPFTVDANAQVAEAARLMAQHGVKRLPVVDEDARVIGIVSRSDILTVFTTPDEVILDEVREDVARRVLMIDPDILEIEVKDGIVTVSGEVPTRTDARLLEELTTRLDGVVRFDSRMSWEIDDSVAPPPPLW